LFDTELQVALSISNQSFVRCLFWRNCHLIITSTLPGNSCAFDSFFFLPEEIIIKLCMYVLNINAKVVKWEETSSLYEYIYRLVAKLSHVWGTDSDSLVEALLSAAVHA